MYYEEQWVDGALCWRTSPDGAWTRYTANELAHRYESAEKRASDAQATVEALQRELESANALLHKKNCAIGKAETTIEALQRERDEANLYRDQARANQESLAACVDRDVRKIKDLQAALDAERERVRQNLLTIMDLQAQHTQLQALVRALVGTKSFTINGPDIRTMGGSVLYACSSPMSAERLGALLEYRERTLDATTPATKGGDGE